MSAIKQHFVNTFSPDDALGSILVKATELGGHVGQCSQTVGVEILILLGMETQKSAFSVFSSEIISASLAGVPAYPRPGHVELDGADDHQDEQTPEGDLRQWPLRVPRDVLQHLGPKQNNDSMQKQQALKVTKAPQSVCTHHLVDGTIESIILCEDEQNNEGHVDVMRIPVLHMVKDLQDGQNLSGRQEKEVEYVSRWWHSLNLCSDTSGAKPLCNYTVQMSKHKNSHAKICGSWLVLRFQYTVKVIFITTLCHQRL